MNWDRIEGQWKQRRGKAVHQWGRLMNDELDAVAGKHEELVGRLQEKYGVEIETSQRRIETLTKQVEQLRASYARLIVIATRLRHAKPHRKGIPSLLVTSPVSRRKTLTRKDR